MMNNAKENKIRNELETSERRSILVSLPRWLIVTLSTRCNSRCIMCEVRHSAWDLPKKTLAEIEELLPTLNTVTWQGGEVFCLDYFEKLFDKACENRDLKQTITTNALLLDERWIDKLAHAPVELSVSIDGTTPQVYEKIRNGSSFEHLLSRLELMRTINEKNGRRIFLRMHVVVMRSNYRQIPEFVKFAKRWGFDAIHLMPMLGGRAQEEDMLTGPGRVAPQEIIDLVEEAEACAKKDGLRFLHSLPLAKIQHDAPADGSTIIEAALPQKDCLFCELPWQQMNIDPGGEVRPGCSCTATIGSVCDQSLLQLWNCEKMQEYRRTIADGTRSQCSKNCRAGNVPEELRGLKP